MKLQKIYASIKNIFLKLLINEKDETNYQDSILTVGRNNELFIRSFYFPPYYFF